MIIHQSFSRMSADKHGGQTLLPPDSIVNTINAAAKTKYKRVAYLLKIFESLDDDIRHALRRLPRNRLYALHQRTRCHPPPVYVRSDWQ